MSNVAVTSREYKLMLNIDRFEHRKQGTKAFWKLVEFLVKKQGGEIKNKIREKQRQTWYLDTAKLDFYQQGFILRIREQELPEDHYQLTLKFRDTDRYIAANQNISTPQEGKIKFEEDILPPFLSKFSHSVALKTETLPELDKIGKLVDLFPGLKSLNMNESTVLKTVNDFKAYEVATKMGKIYFGDKTIATTAVLSFWYFLGEKDEFPVVVEFSFDYDALPSAKTDSLEQFPIGVVEQANRFFKTLQKQTDWVSRQATTKTAYAYEAL